ncbi:hypothetical protein Pelo_18868 [Pelomyxa schiedti]|nr:hypothetical protein Pelo_18868 [Pelomyxa schiedti]
MLVNYESSDDEDNGGDSTPTHDSTTSTSSPPANSKKADDIKSTQETHDDPRALSDYGDGTNCTNRGETSVTPGATKTAVVEAAEGLHTHLDHDRSNTIGSHGRATIWRAIRITVSIGVNGCGKCGCRSNRACG